MEPRRGSPPKDMEKNPVEIRIDTMAPFSLGWRDDSAISAGPGKYRYSNRTLILSVPDLSIRCINLTYIVDA